MIKIIANFAPKFREKQFSVPFFVEKGIKMLDACIYSGGIEAHLMEM